MLIFDFSVMYTREKSFYAGRLPRLPSSKETQEEERSLMLPESKNGEGKSSEDCNDTSIC